MIYIHYRVNYRSGLQPELNTAVIVHIRSLAKLCDVENVWNQTNEERFLLKDENGGSSVEERRDVRLFNLTRMYR